MNLTPSDEILPNQPADSREPKIERLAVLRCISNAPDPLMRLAKDDAYGAAEAIKEGFPNLTGVGFANFFIKGHKGCTAHSSPNRIEFEYVRFLPPCPAS